MPPDVGWPCGDLREASGRRGGQRSQGHIFWDHDEAFFEWLDSNEDGYFVNADRDPRPTYLVLHRSLCPHIDRAPTVAWTAKRINICSASRAAIETWATDTVGGAVTLCATCFS